MADSNDTSGRRPLITRETAIPLGLMAAVLLSAVSGTVWLVGSLKDMQHESEKQAIEMRGEIKSLRLEVQALGQQAKLAASDRWHFQDMVTWAELLKARNPDLSVPIPQKN